MMFGSFFRAFYLALAQLFVKVPQQERAKGPFQYLSQAATY